MELGDTYILGQLRLSSDKKHKNQLLENLYIVSNMVLNNSKFPPYSS